MSHVLWSNAEVLGRIRGVVQVGANVGDEFPTWDRLRVANLLAFEPVPAAFVCARDRAALQPGWRVVQMAVGAFSGKKEFWCGRESGNSSFLPLNPARSKSHQHNQHSHQILVDVTTLDDFDFKREDFNVLYMDVQGTEHEVIAGARKTLPCFDYVCMEVSETEIYLGSWTVDKMDILMKAVGFYKVAQAYGDNPEQADAIYKRIGLA